MVGKGLLVILWFPLTLVLLLVNLALLAATSRASVSVSEQYPRATRHGVTASAETAQILGSTVSAGDARGLLLRRFLQLHESPMAPYADLIVAKADEYGFDYRILPAIAMCESNLGKRMPKIAEFNAFGIAVYTGQLHGKAFSSWEHAIGWVSEYLYTKYYSKGISDLREIGAIWAPPSVENGYSWTNCVQQFTGTIL